MNMQRLGIISTLIMVLLLTGCGPVYRTEYYYTPPSSQLGMACIMQCENSRRECDRSNRLESELAAMRHDQCESDRRREEHKSGKKNRYYCPGYYSSGADCEGAYRSCYHACGGTIQSRTVCTDFCN